MIVIKNSQLTNEAVAAINNLVEMDINAKTAFRLMRIIKEVSSLVEDKLKLEKKIFEKYIDRDDAGNPVPAVDDQGMVIQGAVKITKIDEFNQEMYELMSIENTLNHEKINFDDLNLEVAKIKDLLKIDFLFV